MLVSFKSRCMYIFRVVCLLIEPVLCQVVDCCLFHVYLYPKAMLTYCQLAPKEMWMGFESKYIAPVSLYGSTFTYVLIVLCYLILASSIVKSGYHKQLKFVIWEFKFPQGCVDLKHRCLVERESWIFNIFWLLNIKCHLLRHFGAQSIVRVLHENSAILRILLCFVVV